ncbi:DUF4488 domain-containing protein [Niabella yanshanensis]|uniref:DUF4488 domain-containing protein n=1 Tax=Niabella yanshanensis TaxID=577386 RepID=A0ABZ0W3P8_9BACT|nr:DUF4488 domain-containing protein [Niabella yanshanensis]WQD37893.1 DUF4488 domain-containing protein [Niabella yanshanensis]
MKHVFLASLCLAAHLFVSAQKISTKLELFDGTWQVTMQSLPGEPGKFAPPKTNDFKVYDGVGNFSHIIYVNNKYVELSKGTIEFTSDSTYTEKLEKHLAVPASVKEGKIVFRFLDADTFLMKWSLNNLSGQEVYKRVK